MSERKGSKTRGTKSVNLSRKSKAALRIPTGGVVMTLHTPKMALVEVISFSCSCVSGKRCLRSSLKRFAAGNITTSSKA